jgi:hypothetical protein
MRPEEPQDREVHPGVHQSEGIAGRGDDFEVRDGILAKSPQRTTMLVQFQVLQTCSSEASLLWQAMMRRSMGLVDGLDAQRICSQEGLGFITDALFRMPDVRALDKERCASFEQ